MRKRSLIVACALLTSCSDREIKEAVKDDLIDPDSAQFGEISYSASGNMACAEVNAKNRMGGYTGKKQIYLKKIDGEWTYARDFDESHEDCVASINQIETRDQDTATTNSPAEAAVSQPLMPAKPGMVAVIATEPIWLQIKDGGKTLFEGLLNTGQRYDVPAEASAPRLSTAKPEGLRIIVGEKEVASIGEPGRVVSDLSLRPDDLLR